MHTVVAFKMASQVALGVKNLTVNAGDAGDVGLIPGSGRSPGEGNGSPLQHSCLENPMNRTWRATVHGVTMSWTQLKYLSSMLFLRIEQNNVWKVLSSLFDIKCLVSIFVDYYVLLLSCLVTL